jgi:hypothetical protein
MDLYRCSIRKEWRPAVIQGTVSYVLSNLFIRILISCRDCVFRFQFYWIKNFHLSTIANMNEMIPPRSGPLLTIDFSRQPELCLEKENYREISQRLVIWRNKRFVS